MHKKMKEIITATFIALVSANQIRSQGDATVNLYQKQYGAMDLDPVELHSSEE